MFHRDYVVVIVDNEDEDEAQETSMEGKILQARETVIF